MHLRIGRIARVLLPVCAAIMFARCADMDPTTIKQEPVGQPEGRLAQIRCVVSVAEDAFSCGSVNTTSPAQAGKVQQYSGFNLISAEMPVVSSVILGGQDLYVRLTSTNVVYNSGTGLLSADVTVKNLIDQAIGTTDGSSAAAEGVRVFFSQDPQVLTGTGTVTVTNADGTSAFTASNQPYFSYVGILAHNATSAAKNWHFNVPSTVGTFSFIVYVWAPVQYPDGYVVVTPSSATLDLGSTPTSSTTLSAVVRDVVGRVQSTTISWSSSATGVATVNSSGTVTGVASGDATITATAGSLTGSSAIHVIGAIHHFDVEASGGGNIGTQASGVPFDIRITAKDVTNNTVTSFTGTTVLVANPGSIALGTSGAFVAGVRTETVTISSGNTFTITATRSGGSETGTSNSFSVTSTASAVANDVSGTSSVGDTYHTPLNTALTIPVGANSLLANDNLGFPTATLTSFGAVQCNDGAGTLNAATDAVTANSAGATATLASKGGCTGGSLVVNADGSLTFTPATNYTGLFRFKYRITNSASTSDAQVTLAVGVRPSATSSTYGTTLLGNVPINTATSSGATINAAGDRPVYSVTSNTGGTGAVATDKTYSFTPTAGFSGAASFTYRVQNGFGSSNATVSLTVSSTAIWFINAAASSGDGRMGTPFNCIVGTGCYAATGSFNNGIVYVAAGTYNGTGQLTLKSGQKIIGAGTTTTFATAAGVSWPADAGTQPTTQGASPTIGSATGITLSTGNTLRGITIATSTTNTGLSGSSFGTLTLASSASPDLDINVTNVPAVSLTSGTVSGAFRKVSGDANGAAATGISLNGVTNFAVAGSGSASSGGIIREYTGDGIFITGSSSGTSMDRMNVSANLGNGIHGSTVSGLTLLNSTVDSNGNAVGESGINMSALTGTATLTSNTISNSFSRNIHVANSSGTLNMTVSNGTIANVNATSGDQNIRIEPSGTATINPTITGVAISGALDNHYFYDATGSAGGRTVFSNNTVTRGAVTSSWQGMWIYSHSTGVVEYDFASNTVSGSGNGVFLINKYSSGAVVGKVRNNLVGNGTTGSCSANGNGLDVVSQVGASGTNTVLVTDNTFQHCKFNAMSFDINSTNVTTLNVTARGNVSTGMENEWSLDMETSNAGSTVCYDIGGAGAFKNTLNPIPGSVEFLGAFTLTASAGTLQLVGYTGGPDHYTDIQTYMNGRNNITPDAAGAIGFPNVDGSVTVQNVASCPTPSF